MANEIRTGIQTLNLSARQLKGITKAQGAEWSNELINDYLTILDNFIRIANATDDIIEQVDKNTADIIVNTDNIKINADNIQINVENIQINKDAIALVAFNLQEHEDDNSVHGVTGTVIGTGDFPTESVGGAVKKSALVSNATVTATEILTPSIGAAGPTYTQAYAQQQTDLINEEKTTINDIITDLEGVATQFNDLLAKAKAAEQMTL